MRELQRSAALLQIPFILPDLVYSQTKQKSSLINNFNEVSYKSNESNYQQQGGLIWKETKISTVAKVTKV